MVQPHARTEIPSSEEKPAVTKYGQDRPKSFETIAKRPERHQLIKSLADKFIKDRGENPVFEEKKRSYETSIIALHQALESGTYDQDPEAYDVMYLSFVDALANANNLTTFASSHPLVREFTKNYGLTPKEFIDTLATTQIYKEKKFLSKQYKDHGELTKKICEEAKHELPILEAAFAPSKTFSWWENKTIINYALRTGKVLDTGTSLEGLRELSQKGMLGLQEQITLPSGETITLGNYDLRTQEGRTKLIMEMQRKRSLDLLEPAKESLISTAADLETSPQFLKDILTEDSLGLLEKTLLEKYPEIIGWEKDDILKNLQELFGGGELSEIALSYASISPQAKEKACELLSLPKSTSHEQLQKVLIKLKNENKTAYDSFSSDMLDIIHETSQSLNEIQPLEIALNFYSFQLEKTKLEPLSPITTIEQLPKEFFEQEDPKVQNAIAFFLVNGVKKSTIRRHLTSLGFEKEERQTIINGAIKELLQTKPGTTELKDRKAQLKIGVEEETFDETLKAIDKKQFSEFDQEIQDQAKKEVEQTIEDNDEKLDKIYQRHLEKKKIDRRRELIARNALDSLGLDEEELPDLSLQDYLDLQESNIPPALVQTLNPQQQNQLLKAVRQQRQSSVIRAEIDEEVALYISELKTRTTEEGKQVFSQAKQELLESPTIQKELQKKAAEIVEQEYRNTHMHQSRVDELDILTLASLVQKRKLKKSDQPKDRKQDIEKITTNGKIDPKKVSSFFTSNPQHFSAFNWLTISIILDSLKSSFSDLTQEQQQEIQQLGGLI